jgi:NAD(P)-dependent dehydrogenase (short-subunit alcohol dehydrogenase family)
MSAKTCVVTGASRGIGRAVAEHLLARGREVVAVARDSQKLQELARKYPGKVRTMAIDLAAKGAVDVLMDDLQKRHTRVHEFVHSAGIVRYAAVGDVLEADLRDQLELNFVVPFLLTQRLGAAMVRAGGGAIVLIASTLGLRNAPQTSAYAASKAALLNATKSFALELAPAVRVNAVAPGVVDTDMVRVPRGGSECEHPEARELRVAETLEALRLLHPLGRLGRPEDIAEAVGYLLDATWVTGSVLTVDGGLTSA